MLTLTEKDVRMSSGVSVVKLSTFYATENVCYLLSKSHENKITITPNVLTHRRVIREEVETVINRLGMTE